MEIGVLGGGSWGTALSLILSDNNNKIHLWSRTFKSEQKLNFFKYFDDIKIPQNISLTSSISDILNKKIIFLALPSHSISSILKYQEINSDSIIINGSKGFDLDTNKRLSEMILDIKPNLKMDNIIYLTGPSHAEEIIKKTPTAVIAAGVSKENTKLAQSILSNNYFRVYQSDDIIGAEIGAACKNIISIASGICIGLNYGDNTIASLISRGLQEIVRLGLFMGAKKETFYGLSGIGDLSVTAFSKFSRNRKFGEAIGQGKNMKKALNQIGMIVEGVNATSIVYKISKKHKISMPIVNEVYSILFDNKNPKSAINDLMERKLTIETI